MDLLLAFLLGVGATLVFLAALVALAVLYVKRHLLPPKPAGAPRVAPPAAAPATGLVRRALEELLHPHPHPPSTAATAPAPEPDTDEEDPTDDTPGFCMGWLNVYRYALDAIPASATASPPTAPTEDDTAYPSDPKYAGARAEYAAAHRPRTASNASAVSPGADPTHAPMRAPPRVPGGTAAARRGSLSRGSAAPAPPPPTAATNNLLPFERARSPTCFGVLRHHSLFLYEDETLLDCVGVILLPLHEVALHAPTAGVVPWDDSEAYGKDDPIRLSKAAGAAGAAGMGASGKRKADAWDPIATNVQLAVGEETATGGVGEEGQQRDYYLYAMNAVEKEAWYLALRRASATGRRERVHCASFSQQYRSLRAFIAADDGAGGGLSWLNALLGRAFLTVQDHPLLADYLHAKLTKKLERITAPSFLTALRVAQVHAGGSAPRFSRPELIRVGPAGQIEVEVDVDYTGGARVELATEVVLSLGSAMASLAGKFSSSGGAAAAAGQQQQASGQPPPPPPPYSPPTTTHLPGTHAAATTAPGASPPRPPPSSSTSTGGYDLRVPVVLGVTLAAVHGRLRILLRAPPSNRVWVAFVSAPEIRVRAEPVVNAKHLRLGVVLDVIERKIRELMVQSMVLPNMEDVCFAPSGPERVEGGRFYPIPRAPVVGAGTAEKREADAVSVAETVEGEAGSSSSLRARAQALRVRTRSLTSLWSNTTTTTSTAAAPAVPASPTSPTPASPTRSLWRAGSSETTTTTAAGVAGPASPPVSEYHAAVRRRFDAVHEFRESASVHHRHPRRRSNSTDTTEDDGLEAFPSSSTGEAGLPRSKSESTAPSTGDPSGGSGGKFSLRSLFRSTSRPRANGE
ncbi:hypothetical protein H9P43_009280 [Blastocladiella emersonii ATCC 22665]|nr:hypothetical protein H9P43_009280 [Blastocladiella emersonii ATCC 22665]